MAAARRCISSERGPLESLDLFIHEESEPLRVIAVDFAHMRVGGDIAVKPFGNHVDVPAALTHAAHAHARDGQIAAKEDAPRADGANQ